MITNFNFTKYYHYIYIWAKNVNKPYLTKLLPIIDMKKDS